MTRIAINGFGRVGRAAFRSAFESGLGLELVAINDIADAPTLAQLLAHDTVYGEFPATIVADESHVYVDGVGYPTMANLDRPDVRAGDPPKGRAHGFDFHGQVQTTLAMRGQM